LAVARGPGSLLLLLLLPAALLLRWGTTARKQ